MSKNTCSKKKDINVKPFNMMTNKDEPKAMAEHISCDCKCRDVSTGGKLREPRHPPPLSPIIFLIFVLQNVTILVLHFTFVVISICPGNKSWSIYELPPYCALLFSLISTLVLNWKIIIMLLWTYSVISVT